MPRRGAAALDGVFPIMTNLHTAAKRCLDCADPAEKCRLTQAAWQDVLRGTLEADPAASAPEPIGAPGRPARPNLVAPRDLPRRSLASAEGRAALVHAVAHIEFNAINLAWDGLSLPRHAGGFLPRLGGRGP